MHQTAANRNTSKENNHLCEQTPRVDSPGASPETKGPAAALQGTESRTHHGAGCGRAERSAKAERVVEGGD